MQSNPRHAYSEASSSEVQGFTPSKQVYYCRQSLMAKDFLLFRIMVMQLVRLTSANGGGGVAAGICEVADVHIICEEGEIDPLVWYV